MSQCKVKNMLLASMLLMLINLHLCLLIETPTIVRPVLLATVWYITLGAPGFDVNKSRHTPIL